MNVLFPFRKINKNSVSLVGGKGASLGEMANAGIPVPLGFVIITEVFEQYSNQEIPVNIQNEILKAFDDLNTERVAVRSSAIAEDSGTTSWAGQLESFLNVERESLISKIRQCWNSIKSERAISYVKQNNIPEEKLAVAVVVQKMVESEAAGVAFTVNPITKNENEIMIEACFGLGELLAQGMITPDNYIINKGTTEIKNKTINQQGKMLTFQNGKNVEIKIPNDKKYKQILTDEQIKQLAILIKRVEDYYKSPQDIEWAFEKEKFYIVQSRPITTLQ